MADFHTNAVRLYEGSAPAWLGDLQARGRAIWSKAAMPNRKTEAWKYTSVRALERSDWLTRGEAPSDSGEQIAEDYAAYYQIADLRAARIVFVNGQYSAALSSTQMPNGVELVRFASANASQAEQIRARLGTVVDQQAHLFAALNDSWVTDGVFIRVDKNARVDQPLQVVWLTLPQSEGFSISQRLLLVMEEGSEITLVEQFVSDTGPQNAFTNGTTELVVGDNARLRHYRLHLEEEHGVHIGGVHIDLGRAATLDGFHLAFGSVLKRIDVVVNHRGEGANCNLNGVYLPHHKQHVDYHTCIEHRSPRCTTKEIFRGVIGGSARAVFNGRIHIHPDAQKSDAYLSNKNLLTSNKAEVDTKPELEIYADDVQCAHGTTVSQLDDEAVFYLTSRGISSEDARVMLSFGFINELVDKLYHAPIASYLRPILEQMFARGDAFGRQGV